MSCRYCDQSWFWKKIGRCQRCINQLIVLCVLFWISWIFWGMDHLKDVKAIALLLFGVAFHGLLMLHLWMKWVIFPIREIRIRKQKRKKP